MFENAHPNRPITTEEQLAQVKKNATTTSSATQILPMPPSASEICTHAAALVAGSRAAQHGPKERNFQNIADHWNAYLGSRLSAPLTALDVGLMMIELKVARAKLGAGRSNPDNYVDMAGYAGCAGEIALSNKEEPQP